jgi:hypothetical protein
MKWGPAEEIAVDISLERVTFQDADTAPLEWLPVVYVSAGGQRVKVVSVGQPPADGTPALRVELFAPDPAPAGISKLDCLAAFFTAGLKSLVDRHLFRIKPDVRVHGADRISARFGGYERDLFANALQRAGAKRVRWPEDAPGE